VCSVVELASGRSDLTNLYHGKAVYATVPILPEQAVATTPLLSANEGPVIDCDPVGQNGFIPEERIEQHSHLLWKIDWSRLDGFRKVEYGLKKVSASFSPVNTNMPSWWNPCVHDMAVLLAIHKHGLGQVQSILSDPQLLRMWSGAIHKEPPPPPSSTAALPPDRMAFLRDFLTDKIPVLQRMDYVCQMILHGNAASPYKKKRKDGSRRGPVQDWSRHKRLAGGQDSAKEDQMTAQARSALRKIKRHADGQLVMPLQAKGNCVVLNLGTVTDRAGFHTSQYIWPINYVSTRQYFSLRNPDTKVLYTSKIVDAGSTPGFVVEAADDNIGDGNPRVPVTHSTASAAWLEILKVLNDKRPESMRRKKPSVSGPEMYGFSDPLIKLAISTLPGAARCSKYRGIKPADRGESSNEGGAPLPLDQNQLEMANASDELLRNLQSLVDSGHLTPETVALLGELDSESIQRSGLLTFMQTQVQQLLQTTSTSTIQGGLADSVTQDPKEPVTDHEVSQSDSIQ